MTTLSSTAPKGLGSEARKLWADITGTYTLRPDELRILEDACREVDWIEKLETELEGAPLQVKGSQGQPVTNPLLTTLTQKRQVLRGHLASLKLPDGDGATGSASEAGRALVNNRWRRSG
jgi:hypothetical protein